VSTTRTPQNFSGIYDATSLKTHIAKASTSLCACLKITPTNGGAAACYTTHSADITLGADTFRHSPGFIPSEVEFAVGGVSNLDLEIPFSANGITRAAWDAGIWKHATIDLVVVNFETLTMGYYLFRFKLGAGKKKGERVLITGRGLHAAAQANIVSLTSPTCRYGLGDSRCTKSLAAYTQTAKAVSAVTNQTTFRISGVSAPTVRFDHGKITFTSGANSGLTREIKSYDAGTKEFVMKTPFPYTVAVADVCTVVEGCNKTLADCLLFSNVINFGGEPYTPLPERAFRVPAVAGQ
jgi:uncharacterized phage protein (TIGR02218 family)